jgi:hypothetical protein
LGGASDRQWQTRRWLHRSYMAEARQLVYYWWMRRSTCCAFSIRVHISTICTGSGRRWAAARGRRLGCGVGRSPERRNPSQTHPSGITSSRSGSGQHKSESGIYCSDQDSRSPCWQRAQRVESLLHRVEQFFSFSKPDSSPHRSDIPCIRRKRWTPDKTLRTIFFTYRWQWW